MSTAIDWFAIIAEDKESGWKRFYADCFKKPLSNPKRFFDAVERFGTTIMFESVLAASVRELDGDPLNYILATALAKTNDEIEDITEADKYAFNLRKSKQRMALQNEELEAKLERAKELKNG